MYRQNVQHNCMPSVFVCVYAQKLAENWFSASFLLT